MDTRTNGEAWAAMIDRLNAALPPESRVPNPWRDKGDTPPREEKSGAGERKGKPSRRRDYPAEVILHCRALGLPEPVREHYFHPVRNWRLDLAWPEVRIAIECHGGIHSRGRHVRGRGFSLDREKMNSAATLGWIVVEIPCPQGISQGLAQIERAWERRRKERAATGISVPVANGVEFDGTSVPPVQLAEPPRNS